MDHAVQIRHIQIPPDGAATVDLSSFDEVRLSRQQLGELVGTVAVLVWREAQHAGAAGDTGPAGRRPRAGF